MGATREIHADMTKRFWRSWLNLAAACVVFLLIFGDTGPHAVGQQQKEAISSMELSRTVRLWEFLGSASGGLRILTETWSLSRDQLTMEVSGVSGNDYELKIWNAGLIRVQELKGADTGQRPGWQTLWIHIPPSDSERYQHVKVVIRFWPKTPPG